MRKVIACFLTLILLIPGISLAEDSLPSRDEYLENLKMIGLTIQDFHMDVEVSQIDGYDVDTLWQGANEYYPTIMKLYSQNGNVQAITISCPKFSNSVIESNYYTCIMATFGAMGILDANRKAALPDGWTGESVQTRGDLYDGGYTYACVDEFDALKYVDAYIVATPEPTETPVPTAKNNNPSVGDLNALASALTYLSVMPFSRSGLIEQLEYEGYTTEESTYAVDNCGANWKEQAAIAAKGYLDIMSFSREGLIDQLMYEGYTRSQAEYGVSQNGY